VAAYQVLEIHGQNTMDAPPIDGFYLVARDGAVDLGPDYGKVRLRGLTFEQAEEAIAKHIEARVKDPKVTLKLAGWVTRWQNDPELRPPYRVKAKDRVQVRATPTLPGAPLNGLYTIDANGNLDLGIDYGTVHIEGVTLRQAEDAVRKMLANTVKNPSVSVTPVGWEKDWWKKEWQKVGEAAPGPASKEPASPTNEDVSKSLYRIKPYDVLQIQVIPSVPGLPIGGFYLVEADGRVDLGPGFGKAALRGLTLNEATTAVVKQVRPLVKDPKVLVALAGWVTKWQNDPARKNPYRVRPGQALRIWAMPSLPGADINGPYVVDPDGNVVLGPEYGKVQVAGLSIDQVAEAIRKRLARMIKAPDVSVTPGGWEKDWEKFGEEDGLSPGGKSSASPDEEAARPYRAKPYDVLLIRASPELPGAPLGGPYLVYPDGKVNLGPNYGKVSVDGLTLEKATTAVKKELGVTIKSPTVSVRAAGRVSGWQSAPDASGAYRVQRGQVLTIMARPYLPDAPITGAYKVGPYGMVALGPEYGKVSVAGLTIDQATEAIRRLLAEAIKEPRVSVFPGRWDLLGDRPRPPAKPPEVPMVGREAMRYDGKDFSQWRTELLTELKADIRVEGLKALSAFGTNGYATEATAAIWEMMRGYQSPPSNPDDHKVVNAGLQAIAKIGPAAVPELRKALKDDNRNARRFAVAALMRLGSDAKAALPDLLEAAKDKDPYVRLQVLTALVSIDRKSTGVVSALIAALYDPARRDTAISLLRDLHLEPTDGPEAKELVPALIAAMGDKNEGIQNAAIFLLKPYRTQAREAVPALIKILKRNDLASDTLGEVAEILGATGPAAKDAVPVLNELLQREKQAGLQRARAVGEKNLELVIGEALRNIDKK
jgi:protein involved in polysaccharide export with SLBB domain/HEAT repeat protein